MAMFFSDPPLCAFCGDELSHDWIGGPYGSTLARQPLYWCENPDCPSAPHDCSACGTRLTFDADPHELACPACRCAPCSILIDPRAGLLDPIETIPDEDLISHWFIPNPTGKEPHDDENP